MAKNKHLTLEQRKKIAAMLDEHSTFAQIAATLEKHPSTIAKEVKNHSVTVKNGTVAHRYNACRHRFYLRDPEAPSLRDLSFPEKVPALQELRHVQRSM